MSSRTTDLFVLFMATILVSRCQAGDVPRPPDAPQDLSGSPLTAEVEIYSGGITGDRIGAAYQSAPRGAYGGRFTFGFHKRVNFSLDYLYSNQTRSFSAVVPPVGTLPTSTALMRAKNLNMFFGSAEFNLVQTERAKFYISPGVGFAWSGSRTMSLITSWGPISSPISPGTAVAFNLGAGVKVYPSKRIGLRFDVRDHVSGGGTRNLSAVFNANVCPPGQACPLVVIPVDVGQYFRRVPVQNNLVFTVGLIFKIH